MNDAQKRHVSAVQKTGFATCASVSRVLSKLDDAATKRLAQSCLPSSTHMPSIERDFSLHVRAFGPLYFSLEIRFTRMEMIGGYIWSTVGYSRVVISRNDFRIKCIWTLLPTLRAKRSWKQDLNGYWYRGQLHDE